ncbi:DUF1622 domain-containing protein [Salinimicrobium sp. MT39]|jgi:uncharacterized membrane protein|uniref:DUF1622 domain-containing protein n=1 Tax=Salinimicrobium profundisediminis TaxID=2994553 RepID=A0A9X3D285_9FLAO|nr:DUF1622 domain-containing protein [Salinimicrobium profundisediminis]MCX2839580.1 DUF1622 domain-containing protein [Salinimicrobium profundisediminis]
MHETVQYYVEWAALGIEVAGVLVMIIGPLFALYRYFFDRHEDGSSYRTFRHDLGKAILLGLEFLVAGDIIATVSTDPTMNNVLVLGVIVLIRTFLSLSLQVELEGKWPWQKREIGE